MSPIKAWYGKCGSLITDNAVPGCGMRQLNPTSKAYYGGPFMVGETMAKKTAQTVAKALGLEWCGNVDYTERDDEDSE
jgi:hypothetical protein